MGTIVIDTRLVNIISVKCGVCGVWFGMDETLHARRKDSGDDFWCPNGHRICYAPTELKRLRDKNARLVASLDQKWARIHDLNEQLVDRERSLAATRGVVTRIKNRVGRGVCPCCNRTFENLARHMTSKHPEYASSES